VWRGTGVAGRLTMMLRRYFILPNHCSVVTVASETGIILRKMLVVGRNLYSQWWWYAHADIRR
jgi:hypothetical protein